MHSCVQVGHEKVGLRSRRSFNGRHAASGHDVEVAEASAMYLHDGLTFAGPFVPDENAIDPGLRLCRNLVGQHVVGIKRSIRSQRPFFASERVRAQGRREEGFTLLPVHSAFLGVGGIRKFK